MSRAGQKAFNPNIRIISCPVRDLGHELGAFPARSKCVRKIRNSLIVNLIVMFWSLSSGFLYYSRDNNFYARSRRYHPRCFSARNVIRAVESLEAVGLIEHHKTRPSPEAWYSSTVRLRQDYSDLLGFRNVSDFDFDVPEPIRLKDRDGHLMPYQGTRDIHALRNDVQAQNELLRATNIKLVHPGWPVDEYGLLRSGARTVNPAQKSLYRIFNQGNWALGGRFFGPFWQQLSSNIRRSLLIDEAPTIEKDYHACHPRLMYALVGCKFAGSDPYDIEGFARPVAKRAFQKLVNSADLNSAVSAIAEPFSRRGIKGSHQIAKRLIAAFEKKHPNLTPLFASGIGLRLQRIDSDICAEVQRKLRDQVIPALSVHDSYIVPRRAGPILEDFMAECFERTCESIAP